MSDNTKKEILVLYGSHSGNAEAIAREQIHAEAESHGYTSRVFSLEKSGTEFHLEKEPVVVFVVATHYDGDPTDDADKFMRRLRNRDLIDSHLKNVHATILGLGDSNYTNFCNMGKTLDKRIRELSADVFYPLGKADDAVGLEKVVEPWLEGLWPALDKLFVKLASQPKIENSPSCSETTTSISAEFVDLSLISSPDKDISYNAEEKVSENLIINDLSEIDEKRTAVASFLSKLGADIDVSKLSPGFILVLFSLVERNLEDLQRTFEAHQNDVDEFVLYPYIQQTSSECFTYLYEKLSDRFKQKADSIKNLPRIPQSTLIIQTIDSNEGKSLSNDFSHLGGKDVSIAKLVDGKILTTPESEKTVVHAVIDVSNTPLANGNYQAGDAFGLFCPNDESQVQSLFNHLSSYDNLVKLGMDQVVEFSPNRPAHVPLKCTIGFVLRHCIDIRGTVKKAFLRLMAEYTKDPKQRYELLFLSSREGSDKFDLELRTSMISLNCLLRDKFSKCEIPFVRIVENVAPLQARFYSASSSPLSHPNEVHFALSVVVNDIPGGGKQKGLCTGWLDQQVRALLIDAVATSANATDTTKAMYPLKRDISIPIFPRLSNHFHLPDSPEYPIIMVGPGTGVAPFVGFLHHRQIEIKKSKISESASGSTPREFGPSILFFGCRNYKWDYLYKDELESFVESGALSKLFTCFSRKGDTDDPSLPKYVQDGLIAQSSLVFDLMCNQNGVLYVCGDAKNMAKDVNDALIKIIMEQKMCTSEQASALLSDWTLSKRYLRDVWA